MPRRRRRAAAKGRGSVRAKSGRDTALQTMRTALATAIMLAMLVLGWPAAAMATPSPSPSATATPTATATDPADDKGLSRAIKEPTDDSAARELNTQAPELSGVSPTPTPQTSPTEPGTTAPAETTTPA
ncbi:MAG TPA: hypothetical protein VHH13_11995, partial [Arthrobacter sp.]|nr:hypothetical protein [Arthrobacter sp.]